MTTSPETPESRVVARYRAKYGSKSIGKLRLKKVQPKKPDPRSLPKNQPPQEWEPNLGDWAAKTPLGEVTLSHYVVKPDPRISEPGEKPYEIWRVQFIPKGSGRVLGTTGRTERGAVKAFIEELGRGGSSKAWHMLQKLIDG